MPNQIFKTDIPPSILYNLLEKIAEKKETHYVLDVNSYKKMKYYNLHTDFLNEIIEYYYWSKRFYVERPFTYKSFTNIIRQICKINNIEWKSQLVYIESAYSIVFYIPIEALPMEPSISFEKIKEVQKNNII
jgi:hypothetical protein